MYCDQHKASVERLDDFHAVERKCDASAVLFQALLGCDFDCLQRGLTNGLELGPWHVSGHGRTTVALAAPLDVDPVAYLIRALGLHLMPIEQQPALARFRVENDLKR